MEQLTGFDRSGIMKTLSIRRSGGQDGAVAAEDNAAVRFGGAMVGDYNALLRCGKTFSEDDVGWVLGWNEDAVNRTGRQRLAYTHSFGCQQNAADGEKLDGLLAAMGYGFTADSGEADLILFNTCAVRESAEDRVFGNVGALKNQKRQKPDLMIVLCGCMTQRPEAAERLRKSYPYVDIVFGAGAMERLPSLLRERIEGDQRVFCSEQAKQPAEGLPVRRAGGAKAWLPIMQGCDNFCSYCIVPYVRGREASRPSEEIEREFQEILSQGYREITLLGQNVNSYGKGLPEGIRFPTLLRRLDQIKGDYWLRFMTSHPKDATEDLFRAIAGGEHLCRHIHLPVQSGSDRILREMNRGYTAGDYLALIDRAREMIPGVSFSSDIIVGFPGETREDFEQTLDLVRRVEYSQLFTFLYSRRSGTRAAGLPDLVAAAEKSRWFRELLAVQQEIGLRFNQSMTGSVQRVLIDSVGKDGEGTLAGRNEANLIVETKGPSEQIGQFMRVRISGAKNWALSGEPIQ